jgi:hypothetical protein
MALPLLKTVAGTGAYARLASEDILVTSVILEAPGLNAASLTVRVYGSSDSVTMQPGQWSPPLEGVSLYDIEANIPVGSNLILWGAV